jgi:hypothetical protein
VLREFSVPRGTLTTVNRGDATLYFASADGRVVCAKPAGVTPLKASDVAAAYAELETKRRERPSPPASPEVLTGDAGASPAVDPDDPLRSRRDITPVAGR